MTSTDKLGMVVAFGVVIVFVGIAFGMSSLESVPKDFSSLEKDVSNDMKILEESMITAGQDVLVPKEPTYDDDLFADIAAKVRASNLSPEEIKEEQRLKEKSHDARQVTEEQEFKDSFDDYKGTASQGNIGPQVIPVSIPSGTSTPGCEQVNECYTPANVRINVGDVVLWTNDDTAAHTVSSGNPTDGLSDIFDSSLMMHDTTFEVSFNDSGVYDYFCMVHPWMVGTVIVTP